MTQLQLFTSNRLENLVRLLAGGLQEQSLSSPLVQEVLVVQSAGMKRWLSLQLARSLGVCANTRFVFPNHLLQEILEAQFPGEFSERELLTVDIMTWRLIPLLAGLKREGAQAAPAAYLADEDERKRYQLAARLADTFDQYLIFRPQMIFDWEAGRVGEDADEQWQADLWRKLTATAGRSHRAAWWRMFLESAQAKRLDATGLPERVSVFGISALPAFHVRFLAALARYVPVNLYIMNPCREYWGDILSDGELEWVEKKADRLGIAPADMHPEQGNSLLASMGRVARDFLDLLQETDCREESWFVEPGRETLLTCLQSDILELTGPETGTAEALPETPFPDGYTADQTLTIDCCHSRLREVEVLHDRLLDLFASESGLAPEEVLVMAPDIEQYLPYIEAVFSARLPEAAGIPYTVADRSPRASSAVIDWVLRFFSLAESRFDASTVLEALEPDFVRRRFDLAQSDLEQIRRWVSEAGVRWGIDGDFKAACGVPDFSENTWQSGLDRLLLGWALPREGDRLFSGILPYDELEGTRVEVLNNFFRIWEVLLDFRERLAGRHPLEDWQEILLGLIETFLSGEGEVEADLQPLRQLAVRLGEMAEAAGFTGAVGAGVVRTYLEFYLNRPVEGTAFITGGVTFCSLLPMRSIPFSVVCLLGLNGDGYPRCTRPPMFDRISRQPRRGDRSKRLDDRYLFLETLLSARKRLYISYVGFDMKDNSLLPPSVLVSELLDYVAARFGKTVAEGIRTEHRLQPFHPDYFRAESGLFSYFADYYRAAESLVRSEEEPLTFDAAVVEAPAETETTLLLEDLCRFFEHPVKYFCRNRLGISLDDEPEAVADSEPFALQGLEQYQVNRDLIARRLAGEAPEKVYAALKAAGRLPHGEPGRCWFAQLQREADTFAAAVQEFTGGRPGREMSLDITLNGWRLAGRVENLYEPGWFRYRYAATRVIDRLSAWILHLAVNTAREDGSRGYWAAKDGWYVFAPVKDSREQLQALLDIYVEGQTRLLHFFPRSAGEYVRKKRTQKSRRAALGAAVRSWTGGYNSRPERLDPYYRLCFGKIVPLDDDFENLAEAVLGPLEEYVGAL